VKEKFCIKKNLLVVALVILAILVYFTYSSKSANIRTSLSSFARVVITKAPARFLKNRGYDTSLNPQAPSPIPAPVSPVVGAWGCIEFTEDEKRQILSNQSVIDETNKAIISFIWGETNYLRELQCGLDYCNQGGGSADRQKCIDATIEGLSLATLPLGASGLERIVQTAIASGPISYVSLRNAAAVNTDIAVADILSSLQSNPVANKLLLFLNRYGNLIFTLGGGASCIDNPQSDMCIFFIASTQIPVINLPEATAQRVSPNYIDDFSGFENEIINNRGPSRVLEYKGQRIPLWTVDEALSLEDLPEYNRQMGLVYGWLKNRFQRDPTSPVYFTTNMGRISDVGVDDLGVYLTSVNIRIVAYSQDFKVINYTRTSTHEFIHEIQQMNGWSDGLFISRPARTGNEINDLTADLQYLLTNDTLLLFREGTTDLITRDAFWGNGIELPADLADNKLIRLTLLATDARTVGGEKGIDVLYSSIASGNSPLFFNNAWTDINIFTSWFIGQMSSLLK